VAALIREAQEKRALLQAKQELEGDINKAVPVTTSTDKISETTKRKKKRKKRSNMKIPFNF